MSLTVKLSVAIAALSATVAVGFATGYIHTYNGLNAGIVVGHVGYELVGDPGWFTESDCYLIDVGTPDQPLPVLVSDDTDDGLCHTQS